MSLRLVVSGPIVLAGDVKPDFDLCIPLALPRRSGVYSDRIIHRLTPANDRPKVWGDRDLGHVFCTLDHLVTDLHIGSPIRFLAAMVL